MDNVTVADNSTVKNPYPPDSPTFFLTTGLLTAAVFIMLLAFMLYLICKAWHTPLKPVPMDTELGTKANPGALGKFFG